MCASTPTRVWRLRRGSAWVGPGFCCGPGIAVFVNSEATSSVISRSCDREAVMASLHLPHEARFNQVAGFFSVDPQNGGGNEVGRQNHEGDGYDVQPHTHSDHVADPQVA